MSLRIDIKFNLIATESSFVFVSLLPPLNHNKSTVTSNYIFILYRRGELCSPVFICYELTGDRRSPLRSHIKFNLISPESSFVFIGLLRTGASPVPTVWIFNYSVQNKKAKSEDLAFLELLGRLELPTSSLPRMCSTT